MGPGLNEASGVGQCLVVDRTRSEGAWSHALQPGRKDVEGLAHAECGEGWSSTGGALSARHWPRDHKGVRCSLWGQPCLVGGLVASEYPTEISVRDLPKAGFLLGPEPKWRITVAVYRTQ